jgi:hypothetical protein
VRAIFAFAGALDTGYNAVIKGATASNIVTPLPDWQAVIILREGETIILGAKLFFGIETAPWICFVSTLVH